MAVFPAGDATTLGSSGHCPLHDKDLLVGLA
jgi:hypothetical protein